MMRVNFQDAIKETPEQIKIHLKNKQIEAILLTSLAPPMRPMLFDRAVSKPR